MNDPVVKQLSTDLKEFRKEFLIQQAAIAAMSRTVMDCHSFPSIPLFDSRLISDVPELFVEFPKEQF
jgi:hypothetical protein